MSSAKSPWSHFLHKDMKLKTLWVILVTYKGVPFSLNHTTWLNPMKTKSEKSLGFKPSTEFNTFLKITWQSCVDIYMY